MKIWRDDPTSLGEDQATKAAIHLRNGDVLSAAITNMEFSVTTSYAELVFEAKDILQIVLRGDGQNHEAVYLRNGDRLSGTVRPGKIGINISDSQRAEIEKNKIRKIVFIKRP